MTISLIPQRPRGRGFTLAELLVAMGITIILLTLLVSVTGVALDGWRMSRNKVRAARQAKAALDQLSRDFESFVVRSGGQAEWLYAETERDAPGPNNNKSPNAARLIFTTAATDRYNGDIGGSADEGGDVSTVGYRLFYKDPVSGDDGTKYDVFALYRRLVDPKETYLDVLGEASLDEAFRGYAGELEGSENFLCENIFEVSVVFLVEYNEVDRDGRIVTKLQRIPILSTPGGDAATKFSVRGTGLVIDDDDATPYAKGRIKSVDITVAVITDHGIATLRKVNFAGTALEEFLAKNTYRFSKTILVPQP